MLFVLSLSKDEGREGWAGAKAILQTNAVARYVEKNKIPDVGKIKRPSGGTPSYINWLACGRSVTRNRDCALFVRRVTARFYATDFPLGFSSRDMLRATRLII